MLCLVRWLAAALLLAACEGTHRESITAQALPGDAGNASGAGQGVGPAGAERPPGDVELTPAAGAGLAAGDGCRENADCSSDFCVDGVCCQSSCDTVCSRCDAPGSEGICSIAANDTACTLSCPESSDCRSYGSEALTANCEAVGRCRMLTECTATDAPVGTACQDGAGSCNGQGECIVASKKRLGEACELDDECAEGNCVVGSSGSAICCDAECAGLCQSCGATGRCNETPRDDARCASVDCPDDNLCRDYVDDLEVNLCRGLGQCRTQSDCTFTELRSSAECSCGPSGCTLAVGSSCVASNECASSACEQTAAAEAVCCAQACPAGQSCTADGSRCVQCDGEGVSCEGNVSSRCANGVLSQQMCGNGCNQATGLCNPQRPTGSVCDVSAQCQSGTCAPDVSGTQRCCTAGCAASGRVCGTDGSCICPNNMEFVRGACRSRQGQVCSTDDSCASGACEPTEFNGNVCCSSACPGLQCSGNGDGCVQCEGTGSECQGSNVARCQNNFLQLTSCENGCSVQGGFASCNPLRARGSTCQQTAQCAAGLECAPASGSNRCCDPGCASTGRSCGVNGVCQCPPGQVFGGTRCGVDSGGNCTTASDCLGNLPCTRFFLDQDGDGFGSTARSVCGTDPPPPIGAQRYVAAGNDCCDLANVATPAGETPPSAVNPGITVPNSQPANACTRPYDFNCDGETVSQFGRNPTFVTGACVRNTTSCSGGGLVSASPTCPGTFSVATCVFVAPPGPGCVGSGNGGALSCL